MKREVNMVYTEKKIFDKVESLLNQLDGSIETKEELSAIYRKLTHRYKKLIQRSDRQEANLMRLNRELNRYKFHLEEKIEIEMEQNRVQQELLIQQSKQAIMGEMIAHIAHQWRQPLHSLNGCIMVHIIEYEKGKLTDKKMQEFEDKTNFLVKSMSQTISDFQNFLKPNKQREVFSLSSLFDDTLIFIRDIYRINEIELEIHCDNNIRLYSYPNELIQVFLNILNNAKDAFIDNRVENRNVSVTIEDSLTDVIITFQNNAGELESNLLEQICKPYFTTKDKEKGTGLGLYMCDMIIKNSFGGQMLITNIENGLETKLILPKEVKSEEY